VRLLCFGFHIEARNVSIGPPKGKLEIWREQETPAADSPLFGDAVTQPVATAERLTRR
jgi:hypothetical protein